MKTYKIKLQHDQGTFTALVLAKCKKAAIRQIIAFEGCPKRAIKEIKSWKQS